MSDSTSTTIHLNPNHRVSKPSGAICMLSMVTRAFFLLHYYIYYMLEVSLWNPEVGKPPNISVHVTQSQS